MEPGDLRRELTALSAAYQEPLEGIEVQAGDPVKASLQSLSQVRTDDHHHHDRQLPDSDMNSC